MQTLELVFEIESYHDSDSRCFQIMGIPITEDFLAFKKNIVMLNMQIYLLFEKHPSEQTDTKKPHQKNLFRCL